jgi:hypothetical protein
MRRTTTRRNEEDNRMTTMRMNEEDNNKEE